MEWRKRRISMHRKADGDINYQIASFHFVKPPAWPTTTFKGVAHCLQQTQGAHYRVRLRLLSSDLETRQTGLKPRKIQYLI